MEPVLQKNDVIPLTIESLTNEGMGVGRFKGLAVFVPFTAVGDTAEIQIVKIHPRYAYGIVKKMMEPSTDRIDNDCPVYLKCGGCSFRHISYEAELREKERIVQNNILRLSGQKPKFLPIIPSPRVDRYRNKGQYPVGKNKEGRAETGFYANRSHRLISVGDCLLQPEIFSSVNEIILQWMDNHKIEPYDEMAHKGLVRHLYLRSSGAGDVMVCLVINGTSLPFREELIKTITSRHREVKSIVLNQNTNKTNAILGRHTVTLWGSDTLCDTLCGVTFQISPLSFFQVNREGAELLYRTAAEFADLKGNETVLDLYCGTGTIGLSVARHAGHLIGVEVIPDAIKNAEENARSNGITNAEFLCGDAADAAKELVRRGIKPDVVILDPPRKGSDRDTITSIVEMSPKKIIYVSCDSATLSRDLALFAEHEYLTVKARPVDLFPRTAHVETVVLMSRGNR